MSVIYYDRNLFSKVGPLQFGNIFHELIFLANRPQELFNITIASFTDSFWSLLLSTCHTHWSSDIKLNSVTFAVGFLLNQQALKSGLSYFYLHSKQQLS